jgi:hypothetical protein
MEETRFKFVLATNKLRREILNEKKFLPYGSNYLVGFCLEHELVCCGQNWLY